uniref:SHSP domain-containing protein n=1 Tax=Aegilops tauschii subsp. strangulata TaxID=200361 RepID=A0A453RGC3_AEGTS
PWLPPSLARVPRRPPSSSPVLPWPSARPTPPTSTPPAARTTPRSRRSTATTTTTTTTAAATSSSPASSRRDVLDPLGAPTGMARLLSLMEDVATQTGLSTTAGASRLGRWVAKEDDDAVYLKVPMPGLTKEHVTVRADKNILVIKGEGEKQTWDGDDDSAVPRYNRRIEMPADAYKLDKIKAEMKNGVLWVTLLKVKEDERKDVFHVKVE